MGEKAGNCQLTGADIRNMRADLDSDFMIAPYQEKNATGCGYNLTATEFVYSIRKRRLLAIHKSGRYVCRCKSGRYRFIADKRIC